MEEEITINALGTKCPRPIIELAKAFRKCTGKSTLIIQADDLAFESDVVAWCETTRNRLIELTRSGPVFTAKIEVNK